MLSDVVVVDGGGGSSGGRARGEAFPDNKGDEPTCPALVLRSWGVMVRSRRSHGPSGSLRVNTVELRKIEQFFLASILYTLSD